MRTSPHAPVAGHSRREIYLVIFGVVVAVLAAVWSFIPQAGTPPVAASLPAPTVVAPPVARPAPMSDAPLAPASPHAEVVLPASAPVAPPLRPPVQLDEAIRLQPGSYPANQNPNPAPASR